MRARDTFAWIAVALAFVDLVFFSGASNFLASPQSRILNQALVLGALMIGGIAAARGRLDLRSPLVLPGAAWVGATLVATIASQRQAASVEALALLLLAAPAYLVVRGVLTETTLRRRVDWLVIVATTLFVVAYLLQALTQWISWWSVAGASIPPLRPGDVGLTVGTVNAVSLYLELLAPIAIWLAWVRWRSRVFCGALGLLAGSAMLVTGSRGAWLGVIGGAIVFLGLLWFAAGRPRPRLDGAGRRTAMIGAAAVVMAIVLVGPVLLDRLLSGDAGRLELWSAAASLIASSPIVGIGPGAWPGLRPLTPISDSNLAVLATSHDSVLQLLLETGIVGLLAAMWLVAVIGRLGWIAATRATPGTDRTTAVIALASLVAAAIHSIVDTQFHLPAVMLLVLHLVARVERIASPPGEAVVTADPHRSARLGTMAAITTAGVVLVVPVDIAMVRAALGNQALDRGDAAAAATEFDAAVAMHDLAPYRLGQAIARSRLGDRAGADIALEAMERAQPFTFVVAQRAATSDDPATPLERLDRADDYDPTASVNAAVIGFASDPTAATRHLAAAMARVPTLVFSVRPPTLFDDATWAEAQRTAIDLIGMSDPVMAAAVATLAGLPEGAADHLAAIGDGAERDALALLAAGDAEDVDAATGLLRANPSSVGVQDVLWLYGFATGSQPLLDAVQAVAVPLRFNVPLVPMELVVDGRIDAGWSMRLPRWPMASDGRNGPKRPYIDGFVTIEPVYRPKP